MANRYPDNSLVLLNLGLARYWSGDNAGAAQAWTDAYEAQPDTESSLTADRLLHPNTPPGIPIFVPGFAAPVLHGKTPAQQVAELAAAARKPDVHARLAYGIALQRVGREVSAQRAYASAARLAPDDPEPLVAEAVARFSRSQPVRGVLAPRAADKALSAFADGPLPPRPPARVAAGTDRCRRSAVPQGREDRPERPAGERGRPLAQGTNRRAQRGGW